MPSEFSQSGVTIGLTGQPDREVEEVRFPDHGLAMQYADTDSSSH